MRPKVRKRIGRLKRHKGRVKGGGAEGQPGLITQSLGARKESRLFVVSREAFGGGYARGKTSDRASRKVTLVTEWIRVCSATRMEAGRRRGGCCSHAGDRPRLGPVMEPVA